MITDREKIEHLLTVDELCSFLGIPKKSIYKWTSDRHSGIPYYKIGRHLRFRKSDVDSWLIKYRSSDGAKEFAHK